MSRRRRSVHSQPGAPDEDTLLRWYESTIYWHPEVMNGMYVFAGTIVPIQALLEYLFDGWSIDDFKKDFPTVSHQQVKNYLLMNYEGIPREWESVKFRAGLIALEHRSNRKR